MQGKKVEKKVTGETGYVRHVEPYQGHPAPDSRDYVPAAFYLLVMLRDGSLVTWPAHQCREVEV